MQQFGFHRCFYIHRIFEPSAVRLNPVYVCYCTFPNSFRGQTRKTIFPTICSSEIHPMTEFRESAEVDRWSPITKYLASGTW